MKALDLGKSSEEIKDLFSLLSPEGQQASDRASDRASDPASVALAKDDTSEQAEQAVDCGDSRGAEEEQESKQGDKEPVVVKPLPFDETDHLFEEFIARHYERSNVEKHRLSKADVNKAFLEWCGDHEELRGLASTPIKLFLKLKIFMERSGFHLGECERDAQGRIKPRSKYIAETKKHTPAYSYILRKVLA
jgi:hypothetical protein